MTSKSPFQYVTCLFDLGRAGADGRTIDNYISWLVKTAKSVPNLTVFTDLPNLEQSLPDNCRVEHFPFEGFELYKHRDRIRAICDKEIKRNGTMDITVRIPDYAILQFGKFQLMEMVAQNLPTNFVVWVDAGISRFTIPESPIKPSRENYCAELLKESSALLEVDFRKNIRFGRLRHTSAGSFRKTFSGGVLVIKATEVARYRLEIVKIALSWLSLSAWDNEQIALNQAFHQGSISPWIVAQEGEPGTTLRVLQGNNRFTLLKPNQGKYRRLRSKGIGDV